MPELFKDFIRGNFYIPHKDSLKTGAKPRIEFIDLAKGVCILLVILFHCKIYFPAAQAIRMPLYFILSGLFFKDYGGTLMLIEKKINKLIIPFCFFIIMGFGFHWYRIGAPDFEMFLKPFYQTLFPNFPIWFLLSLFWCNLIYCIICNNVNNFVYRLLIIGAIGITGYLLAENHLYVSLYLASSFTALPFFFIGVLLRKLPLLYPHKHDYYFILGGIAVFGLCIYLTVLYGTPHIDFMPNKFVGNPGIIYLLSISLVVSLLLVCKAIRWLPVVSYLGRYSIILLGLHGAIIQHIVTLYLRNFKVWPEKYLLFSITLFVCWICIPFLIKYAAKFTAQKDWVKLSRVQKNDPAGKDSVAFASIASETENNSTDE